MARARRLLPPAQLAHLLSTVTPLSKAFFYASAECLEWAQRLMLKLWSYLLTQAEQLPYPNP